MYISSSEQLLSFITRAHKSSVLAIDTEFLRENTYFPQLCLLQIATENEEVIIDPFTVGSLKVLRELFEDPRIIKLFHAGSQDIEILYHEVGVMPLPLFDTQIAAALLGHTLQIGYGSLVQNVCGITLKKGDSFTDWSRRPLSKSQLSYALDDVKYLPRLYQNMVEKLSELHRLHWLDDEFASLAETSRYIIDPRERYRKLKRVNQLSRRQLSAAREATAWREEKARKRNIPRKWILSDEQIIEACRREANSVDQLFMVRGISEKISLEDAREVVAAMKYGYQLPEEEWPELDQKHKNEASVDVEVDALATIVRLRSKEHNIAFQALANHSDLVDVARGYSSSNVLKGWRYDIVGKDLRAFLAGELVIQTINGVVKVTKRK